MDAVLDAKHIPIADQVVLFRRVGNLIAEVLALSILVMVITRAVFRLVCQTDQ